jgi:hypothetical protein
MPFSSNSILDLKKGSDIRKKTAVVNIAGKQFSHGNLRGIGVPKVLSNSSNVGPKQLSLNIEKLDKSENIPIIAK